MKSTRRGGLVVDRLHPLLGQRAGVLDALLADRARTGLDRRRSSSSVAQRVHDAARHERLVDSGELLLRSG